MASGDRVFVGEAKKLAKINDEKWREIKRELIDTGVIEKDKTSAVDRYFKV